MSFYTIHLEELLYMLKIHYNKGLNINLKTCIYNVNLGVAQLVERRIVDFIDFFTIGLLSLGHWFDSGR